MKKGRPSQVREYIERVIKTVTWRYLVKIGILALIYIVAAKLGLSFAYGTEQVTTIWPPTGIALAALLLLGYRYWPGILIGAFVANLITNETAAVAAGIAAGNTLEALTGSFLLRRVGKLDINFSRFSDFFSLLILAGGLSTLISATIGTSVLGLGDLLDKSYLSTWLVWWVGDTMGALVFAPLILIFFSTRFRSLWQKPVEAGLLLILSSVACGLIFSHSGTPAVVFPYLIFPLIFWASLRFTQAGAAVIITLVSVIAVWGTVAKSGPFIAYSSVERNLILLHTFLLVAIVSAMLAAITSHRQQQAEQALRNRNQRLKMANLRVKSLLKGALGEIDTQLKSKLASRDKKP